MLFELIVMLELGPALNASSIRIPRPAPFVMSLQVMVKPLTAPKRRMSAVAESVELWMLFIVMLEEATLIQPIARRFPTNSLFDTVSELDAVDDDVVGAKVGVDPGSAVWTG